MRAHVQSGVGSGVLIVGYETCVLWSSRARERRRGRRERRRRERWAAHHDAGPPPRLAAVELQYFYVLKLAHVDELAGLVQREREQLERLRHVIFAEKLALEQRRAQQPQPPLSMVAVHLPAAGGGGGAVAPVAAAGSPAHA